MIETDAENSYLSNSSVDGEMTDHQSHSIMYRIGNVCYEFKTSYRDGTTHVIFDPLDFISNTPHWFHRREQPTPIHYCH